MFADGASNDLNLIVTCHYSGTAIENLVSLFAPTAPAKSNPNV